MSNTIPYTAKEVAVMWECSPETVRRRCRLGDLDSILINGQWFIRNPPEEKLAPKPPYTHLDKDCPKCGTPIREGRSVVTDFYPTGKVSATYCSPSCEAVHRYKEHTGKKFILSKLFNY